MAVVGPTLARSAFFENVSGAYLYALLPGALHCYRALLSGTDPTARVWLKALFACSAMIVFTTLASSVLTAISNGR